MTKKAPEPPAVESAEALIASNRLEVAKALNDACAADLSTEENRGRALDQKLNQTASFAGVVLALVGSVGGALTSTAEMTLAWRISTGSTLVVASLLLLIGIVRSFVAVAPKQYLGVDEKAVSDRTLPSALNAEPAQAIQKLAATKRDVFNRARQINDDKAISAVWSTAFVMSGMAFVVLTLLLRTIENITT